MGSIGIRIAQSLFQPYLRCAALSALHECADVEGRMQQEAEQQLRRLSNHREESLVLGQTEWGYPVSIPMSMLLNHGIVCGATGAGKSCSALLMLVHSLARFPEDKYVALGFGDPKRDLGTKALEYISARAYRLNETQRARLREKVWVMDVAQSDFVTPYNILACQHMSPELLVNNRIEMISKIYGRGSAAVTTRMKSILKHLLLLMVEMKLPITMFERLCLNTGLLQAVAAQSKHERLRHYFTARFPREPKTTVLGLCQRIESLCNMSEGVRLSLSASSAPDFQKLQDEGYLVVMNFSGPEVSRRTSDFLLQILVSDIQQSVFRRRQADKKYVWCLDESQLLMRDAASLENLIDLVSMSRSFGSYFVLLSQALTSAVGEVNSLNAILQNFGWSLLFRSTVREAKIIAPALPVTGTMLSQKRFPYDTQKFLAKDQELNARLEEITHFSNRTAYLWLRSKLPQAVKIRTQRLPSPEEIADCSRVELDRFRRDFPLENLIPRSQVERELEQAERRLAAQRPANVPVAGADASADSDSNAFLRFLEKTYAKRENGKDKS